MVFLSLDQQKTHTHKMYVCFFKWWAILLFPKIAKMADFKSKDIVRVHAILGIGT